MKQKQRQPVGCVILCILAALPVIRFGIAYSAHLLHVHRIKQICRKQAALLDEIAEDFAVLYREYQPEVRVSSAVYKSFEDSFYIDCAAVQEDGSITWQRAYPPLDERIFAENLAVLREKYRKKDAGYAFNYVRVTYDKAGNMLIELNVYQGKVFRDSADEPRMRTDRLIYMDEAFDGDKKWVSYLADETPAAGRWFYWSENSYLG